jgi:hypothetical protein
MTNCVNPVLDALHLWAALEWLLAHTVGLHRRPDTYLRDAGPTPDWLRDVMPRHHTNKRRAIALLAALLLCGAATAQTSHFNSFAATQLPDELPDAPLPPAQQASSRPAQQTSSSQQTIPADEQQTKRVMGIMPNFRSVSPGETPPPATLRQKFITTSQDNFDYSALIFSGLIAGSAMSSKSTPEFHQGMVGYGRYYWHTLADQCVENYFVEFIIPAINHEDSRYYAMGKRNGGFFKRAGYSLSRIAVTRSDTGKPMFNYGEVAGSAMAASVSSLYYPSQERTADKVLRNWGLDLGYDAFTFMFHEFWPDIHHSLFPAKSRASKDSGGD